MGLEKVQNYITPNFGMIGFTNPINFSSNDISIWNNQLPTFNYDSNTPLFNFTMPNTNPFGLNNFNFSLPTMNFNNIDWQAGLQQATQLQSQYIQNYIDNMKAMFEKLKTNNPQNPNQNANTGVPADYGNYNFDVTQTKYTGNAKDLNKHLEGVLKGKGKKLLELQEKYGINAAFLAALVNHESGNGRSNAAKNKNNVAGIMSAESNFKELRSFKNVDECLETLAKLLSANYINKGYTTISQIHSKYCPIGANNDPTGLNGNWGKSINALTNQYMSEA